MILSTTSQASPKLKEKIIDGKAHAAALLSDAKEEVRLHTENIRRPPGLATVLVGEDAASHVYVAHKRKKAAFLGFADFHHVLPRATAQHELVALLEMLKADDRVDGILVQLPLPRHISVETIIQVIGAEKDVDGFHPNNLGEIFFSWNEFALAPCTPYGIIKMFEREKLETRGQHTVIVGRSAHVSRPLAAMLMQRGHDAVVTVLHRHVPEIAKYTKEADILIVAVGKIKLITADMVKPGAVVIDIGINALPNGKITGDVDFANVLPIASRITPVPGGVGPLTIAALMLNTLKIFKRRNGLK